MKRSTRLKVLGNVGGIRNARSKVRNFRRANNSGNNVWWATLGTTDVLVSAA